MIQPQAFFYKSNYFIFFRVIIIIIINFSIRKRFLLHYWGSWFTHLLQRFSTNISLLFFSTHCWDNCFILSCISFFFVCLPQTHFVCIFCNLYCLFLFLGHFMILISTIPPFSFFSENTFYLSYHGQFFILFFFIILSTSFQIFFFISFMMPLLIIHSHYICH